MSNADNTNVENPLETLQEAVNVALALGAKIPPPIGTEFFQLIYINNSERERDIFSLGCYQDLESCTIALVNYIILGLTGDGEETPHPWAEIRNLLAPDEVKEKMLAIRRSENPLKAYLESHTDSEIIKWYFSQSKDSYEVNHSRINKRPDPIVAGITRKQEV